MLKKRNLFLWLLSVGMLCDISAAQPSDPEVKKRAVSEQVVVTLPIAIQALGLGSEVPCGLQYFTFPPGSLPDYGGDGSGWAGWMTSPLHWQVPQIYQINEASMQGEYFVQSSVKNKYTRSVIKDRAKAMFPRIEMNDENFPVTCKGERRMLLFVWHKRLNFLQALPIDLAITVDETEVLPEIVITHVSDKPQHSPIARKCIKNNWSLQEDYLDDKQLDALRLALYATIRVENPSYRLETITIHHLLTADVFKTNMCNHLVPFLNCPVTLVRKDSPEYVQGAARSLCVLAPGLSLHKCVRALLATSRRFAERVPQNRNDIVLKHPFYSSAAARHNEPFSRALMNKLSKGKYALQFGEPVAAVS